MNKRQPPFAQKAPNKFYKIQEQKQKPDEE
jgi:hypothetical protein